MQTADTTPARAPEDTPALVKKIGKITYKMRVHFSNTRTETMCDKIKHMLQMKYGRNNSPIGIFYYVYIMGYFKQLGLSIII